LPETMMLASSSYGVVGLGVMGSSLILNLAEKTGSPVSGFDLSAEKCASAEARALAEGFAAGQVRCFSELGAFVESLSVPRKVVLLVPAGPAVDACLGSMGPLLSPGDAVMDGGNEWYENSERREAAMRDRYGVHYLGCGVSGGADGARHGPALMVGGAKEAFSLLRDGLEKIAARARGAPCVVYCGPGGAGNYVKMVHNGIEYGDMELIGEAYALLKAKGLSNSDCADLFATWNEPPSELRSFLIEITAKILRKKKTTTQEDGGDLIDNVLDKTGSKGTGKWTVQEAANQGVSAPTIAAALDARYASAHKATRLKAATTLTPPRVAVDDASFTAEDLEAALVCSKICTYAQGLALINAAKQDKGWTDLRVADVLRCWRGGCIIRAKLLVDFADALVEQNDDDRDGDDQDDAGGKKKEKIDNLLLHPAIAALIADREPQWRRLVANAIADGQVPVPALAASLAYFDALRSPHLQSAALIQAQRDCFGGHTYKHLDDPDGPAHTTDWLA